MSAEKYEKPPELQALHDAIDKSLGLARTVKRELEVLSAAFSMTGNSLVAEKLCELAPLCEDAAREVRKAHHDDTMRQLREAEQGSAQLFKAVMAGVFATPEERRARESAD